MAKTDQFTSIPKEKLVANQPLNYDLFLHLQENDSIVFFKHKGESLEPAEIKHLNAKKSTTILIKKDDLALVVQTAGDSLVESLKNKKPLDSKDILNAASLILKSMDWVAPAPGSKVSAKQVKKESLIGVHTVLQKMINEVGSKPIVLCYDTIMDSIKNTHMSDLDLHGLQVSALAVLMYLTEGKGSADEVADLAFAGLVHDIGLSAIASQLQDRHLSQKEDFNQFEMEEYFKHIDLSIQKIKQEYPSTSQKVLKAVEFHHENFDGSGPKKVQGNYIPHMARVLRIAEDVSLAIARSKFKLEFKDALSLMTGPNLLKYDMSIVQSINDHYLSLGIGI